MTVSTRHIASGRCDDGHSTSTYDLIIAGKVYASAAMIHQDRSGRQDIYFDPPELRDWLESDHVRLHEVGVALAVASKAVRS